MHRWGLTAFLPKIERTRKHGTQFGEMDCGGACTIAHRRGSAGSLGTLLHLLVVMCNFSFLCSRANRDVHSWNLCVPAVVEEEGEEQGEAEAQGR